MTIKRRKFSLGIRLKGSTSATTLEGEMRLDPSALTFKAYVDGAERSLVTEDQAQTLTNKTIDADNNTISELETDNFKADVVDTDVTLAADSDTRIATQKATKAYVDSQVASKDEASEISYDDTANTKVVGADVQAALDAADTEIAANATAIGDGATDLTNHEADTSTHGVGEIVGTTEAQTLSNKSIQTPSRSDTKQDTEANLITYAGSASNGQFVFATDTKKMYQILDNELASVGGGGSTQFEINQVAHGLAVGDGIYHNGTIFVKGQADDADTLAYYVVILVEDVDNFTAVDMSRVESPTHGFTIGEFYWLSDSVAGQPTSTEPSSGFSNPLFYVEDANTLQIKVYRPDAIQGIDLDDLDDVSVPSPTDNQVLAYDNGNSRWEAKDAVSAAADVTTDNSGSSLTAVDAQATFDEVAGRLDTNETDITALQAQGHDLDDLTDVDITAAAKGDLLVYNSTSGNYEELPVGADGTHLVMDSNEDLGMKYTDALSGTLNPVTDWTSYTPTGHWDTNVTYTGKYRRVGDTLEGQIVIDIDGGTPSPAGDFNFTPAELLNGLGLSLDTDKLPSGNAKQVGTGSYLDSGSKRRGGISMYYLNSVGNFRLSDANTSDYQSASPEMWTTGDSIHLTFSVPIQDWTSGVSAAVQGVTLDNVEAEGNAGQAITANTTNISFIEVKDVNNNWSGAAFVPTEDGYYSFKGSNAYAATGAYVVQTYIDGVASKRVGQNDNSASGTTIFSGTEYLLAGEELTFRASLAGTNNLATGASTHWLNIKKENDTGVITGTFENINSSDLVNVFAAGTSAGTWTAGSAFPFTEVVDNTSSWDGSVFTAPKDGRYTISGQWAYTGGAVYNITDLYLDTGGGYNLVRRNGGNLTSDRNPFMFTEDLSAGDKIYVSCSSNNTPRDTVTNNTYISITESADTESIIKNLNDQEATVAAKYRSNAGQAITTSFGDIKYEDEVYDTHSAYNIATGVYTVPVTGYYDYKAILTKDAVSASRLELRLDTNGVGDERSLTQLPSNVAGSISCSLQTHLYLNEGDTLLLKADCDANCNANTGSSRTYFSIMRIK